MKWYRKAAEQGDAKAQYNLGHAYYNGEGVEQDYVEAVRWYRLSADQGYAGAQFMLGNAYYFGEGVPKDDVEAVKWWRKSADQGFAGAQCGLGVAYALGIGVPKDDVEAYAWINVAAVTDDEAKQARSELEKSMSQSDIARARSRSTELFESIRLKRRP